MGFGKLPLLLPVALDRISESPEVLYKRSVFTCRAGNIILGAGNFLKGAGKKGAANFSAVQVNFGP